jgi:O-antigen ligase
MQSILKNIELLFLSLMITTLPSLEAPKNIFLVFFVVVAVIRQLANTQRLRWNSWDTIFLLILASAGLSTIFAGMPNHEEWKGYRVLITMISTGWLVSRSQYSDKELGFLFKVTVISTIPPLAFGLWQLYVTHAKHDLQLHSVGHVNHSAIYLTMITGAAIGWLLSLNKNANLLTRSSLAALCALLLVSLIAGQSRAAVGVGFMLAITTILLLSRSKLIKIYGLLASALILALAVLLNVGVVQKQVAYEKTNNILSNRDQVWNVSIEAARFSPILGIGMSNWHFITLDQLKASVEKRGKTFDPTNYQLQWGHSHNVYLTALVDRGFVGLGVTLIFMFAWLRHLIATFSLTRKFNEATFLWAGSFSAWLATFGIGFVNTTFHHEHGILACLFLGLYLSYTQSHKNDLA